MDQKYSLLVVLLAASAFVAASVDTLSNFASTSSYCDTFGSDWLYNETVDKEKQLRILYVSSCPNHYNSCQERECGSGEDRFTDFEINRSTYLYGDAQWANKQIMRFEIPLVPTIAVSPWDATCSDDTVAIALNGVHIKSQFDEMAGKVCKRPSDAVFPYTVSHLGNLLSGRESAFAGADYITGQRAPPIVTVAGQKCDYNGVGVGDGIFYCGDSVASHGGTFDKCGGHANRQTGLYHYHTLPICLLNQLTEQQWEVNAKASSAIPPVPPAVDPVVNTTLSKVPISPPLPVLRLSYRLHSPQLAWAMDGFPVYGPLGPGGVVMLPCDYEYPGNLDTAASDAIQTDNNANNDNGGTGEAALYTNPHARTNYVHGTEAGIKRSKNPLQPHPRYCLDRCNGYYGELPGIDSYTYRYYISAGSETTTVQPLSTGQNQMGNDKVGLEETEPEDCSDYVINAGVCERRPNVNSNSINSLSSETTQVLLNDPKNSLYHHIALSHTCCMKAVPSRAHAPYTIGCLRGCTAAQLAKGECATSVAGPEKKNGKMVDNTLSLTKEQLAVQNSFVSSVGISGTFYTEHALANTVKDVYTGRKFELEYEVDTVTPTGSVSVSPTPTPGPVIDTASMTAKETNSLFRYASNRSLAILHTTSYTPLNAPATLLSNVSIPTQAKVQTVSVIEQLAGSTTAEHTNINIRVDQVLTRDKNKFQNDDFITASASTETLYQQLLALPDPTPSVETVAQQKVREQSSKDMFFTTYNTNKLRHQLFYGSNNGIYAINVADSSREQVIRGYLVVSIYGYNLGVSQTDIKLVTVKGHECTSVLHLSSTRLQCSSSYFNPSEIAALTHMDVCVITAAGEMCGIYLSPAVMLAEQALRPIISDIEFNNQHHATASSVPQVSTPANIISDNEFGLHLGEFLPYALALSPTFTIYSATTEDNTYKDYAVVGDKNSDGTPNEFAALSSDNHKESVRIQNSVKNDHNPYNNRELINAINGHLYYSILSSSVNTTGGGTTGTAPSSNTHPTASTGLIVRSDYHGNSLRVIVRGVPKCIAMVVVQPALERTAAAVKVPDHIPPFHAHTDVNLGTPNSQTGINVEPGRAISPDYTLLNPVANPIPPVNEVTTTSNATVIQEYLFYLDSSSNALYATKLQINDEDLAAATRFGREHAESQVVLTNLQEPKGITVDHGSNSIFITCLNGLVLQINLAWAVSIADINSAVPVPRFVSAGVTSPYMLPTAKSSAHMKKAIIKPYSTVITVLTTYTRSSTRLFGVAVAPLLFTTIGSLPWKQERLFVADTNMNEILASASLPSATSDTAHTYNNIELSTTLQLSTRASMTSSSSIASIYWPTSIVAVIDTQSDTNIHVRHASGGISTTDTVNYVLYVTEYLGKIWRVKVTRNTRGKYEIVERPTCIVEPLPTSAATAIQKLASVHNLYYDVVD